MPQAVEAVEVAPTRLRWAKALLVAVALLVVAHNVIYAIAALPIDKGMGSFGLFAGSELRGGYALVDRVAPGRPADEAGLRQGDWIRFDRPLDLHRVHLPTGETLSLTIRRGDETLRATLTAPPTRIQPAAIFAEVLTTALLYSLLALAGGLIALRGRRASTVTLGGALAVMGLLAATTILWEHHPALEPVIASLINIGVAAAPAALLGFALLRRRETDERPIPRVWWILFWVYAGQRLMQAALDIWTHLTLQNVSLPGGELAVDIVPHWAGYALAIVLLAMGWRKARGQERTRYGFLTVSLVLLFLGGSGLAPIINMTGGDFSFNNPLTILADTLFAAGIVGFLYAALRHRVVDLGFAVNRTLVYGLLSTALLVVFFFLSWGVNQVIPASMQQSNLLVSTGIALFLFFAFHHAQGWVEKGVQSLFFRRWRRQEQEFRRFLRQTGFITRPDVLIQSAADAISRFADDTPVALYRRDGNGYALEAGGIAALPTRLDADLPSLVRLRAEMTPQDENLPPGVTLLLPMPYRNEVTGLIAVGARPDGETIRPDQAELLAEAAVKVGLDLHALRVIALEAENREQRLRADMLQEQIERLARPSALAEPAEG